MRVRRPALLRDFEGLIHDGAGVAARGEQGEQRLACGAHHGYVAGAAVDDVLSALTNLGYQRPAAEKAMAAGPSPTCSDGATRLPSTME